MSWVAENLVFPGFACLGVSWVVLPFVSACVSARAGMEQVGRGSCSAAVSDVCGTGSARGCDRGCGFRGFSAGVGG